ncbi:hypothetical protein [Williamsia herbipolensis]|uniref:hypothetical protein n=1 Tax=Williamsia herbipolensis TaxID=1603258 RepID=UPI000A5D4274|nr:hypothetical protein [Williamsia herbipolensis]
MKVPTADQGPHASIPIVAPHGFDHNGPGAGLAAINATVRMSVAADDQWSDVGNQLLAPGPSRDAWTIERVRVSITAPATDPPKICGYQMRKYTPQRADVAIIARQKDGSYTSNAASVVWGAEGDWQLQLPVSSSTASTVTAVDGIPPSTIALKGQC